MRHFSTASAAEHIGCGRATLNRAIGAGILPAEDVSLKSEPKNPDDKHKPRWRIREDDLLEFQKRMASIREHDVPDEVTESVAS